jgi:hypothetical protein
MNHFYSSEQTDLSRAVLGEVVAAVPAAILIGGWGSWVRTGGPMSHDVDLIVTRDELAALERIVGDLSESHHLAGTKWRATWRSIHLDLHVPFQSRLGANLQLRVELLTSHAETANGYRVLTSAAHTATKIAALLDRPDSLPGRKDRFEILKLLEDPSTSGTPLIIAAASARTPAQVDKLVRDAFVFLTGEPELNRQARSRLRRMEAVWRRAVAVELGAPEIAPDLGPSMGGNSKRNLQGPRQPV